MSELTSTGVRLHQRRHGGMGVLTFVCHHLSLVKLEKAQQKDRSVPKPLKVVLTDGTGWNLDYRSGVDWHISYPGWGKRVVSSAKVAKLPSKWDNN